VIVGDQGFLDSVRSYGAFSFHLSFSREKALGQHNRWPDPPTPPIIELNKNPYWDYPDFDLRFSLAESWLEGKDDYL
jgi:hypothetical protein